MYIKPSPTLLADAADPVGDGDNFIVKRNDPLGK
jgi:hypothetical protein